MRLKWNFLHAEWLLLSSQGSPAGLRLSKGEFILILSRISRPMEPRLGSGGGKEAALRDLAPRWSHRASDRGTEGRRAPEGVERPVANGTWKTASPLHTNLQAPGHGWDCRLTA